ncbi:hypothetical protein [Acinetobacter variabilis]|uniref:hypothetical protein n=1 Tax=Acinetobacter variabilis TaxID=70346 RepID=UPI002FDA31DE
MNDYDFLADIESGISASEEADQNKTEIMDFLASLGSLLQEKYGIEIKLRNVMDFEILKVAFPITPATKPRLPEQILSLNKDGKTEDIATIKLEDVGYPVKVSYDGKHNYCSNIESLKSEISQLLKSAYFGSKIKKMI